jgi:hypothetical protein
MKQLWLFPIRVESPPVFLCFLAFFCSADTDASAIHRNGASHSRNTLRCKSQLGLLCKAGFIGKMVRQGAQGFYVN